MLTRWHPYLIVVFCLGSLLPFVASSGAAAPIKIAAIFALTGKAKNSNTAAVLGAQLAVQEINREGGLLGEKVELLLLDNHSTPIGSHLAAKQAVTAGVIGIIGSVWSDHSLAMAKVAEQNKIPMISPISTIPSLTAIGDHIFRVCYDDNFQGSVIAQFAYKKLKARKALVLVDIASDFSVSITEIFSRSFQALGGRIIKEIEYKAGQPSYQPQVQQAVAHDADIIFFSGHDESGQLAKEIQEAGGKAIPVGTDGWDVESFYASGGNKIKRGYFINHWTPALDDPASQAFMTRYGNKKEVKAATALAFDAVQVLAAAIRKAGSTDSTAIRTALHSLQGFHGVTGTISFDAQRNTTKRACLMEIREGVPFYLGAETSP